MPVASAVAAASTDAPVIPTIPVEDVITALKGMSVSDLVHLSKAVTLEVEKKFKVFEKEAAKASKVKKPKKAGSMPKGVLPPQFRKPNAWKAYVFADAKAHGWPSFTVQVNRKNKETGEKEPENVLYSASKKENGVFVFDNGRAFNEKDAMSLSKIYWDNKEQKGLRADLWKKFDAQYVDEAPRSSSVSSSASSAASTAATPVTSPQAAPKSVKRVQKK